MSRHAGSTIGAAIEHGDSEDLGALEVFHFILCSYMISPLAILFYTAKFETVYIRAQQDKG